MANVCLSNHMTFLYNEWQHIVMNLQTRLTSILVFLEKQGNGSFSVTMYMYVLIV